MTKINRLILGAFLIALLAALAYRILTRHDTGPVYEGKSLSEWLTQLNSSYPEGMDSGKSWQAQMSPAQAQAAEAVQRVGTNAIPYLIHALTNVDSRGRERFASRLRMLTGSDRAQRRPGDEQRKAAFGLAALGPTAQVAIPELKKAMNDPLVSAQAAVALASIGPDGWEVLSHEISGTNSFAAHHAIKQLANYRAAVPGGVQTLMARITNSPSGWIYLNALARIGPDDEGKVQFFANLLRSSNASFRLEAVYGLKELGTNARNAIPALVGILHDEDINIRRAATNSLKQIDAAATNNEGDR